MSDGSTNRVEKFPRRLDFPRAGAHWPHVTIAICLSLFLVLATAICLNSQPYFPSDLATSRRFQSVSLPGLEALMRGVSLAGDSVLISGALLIAAFVIIFRFRLRREATMLLVCVATGQIVTIAVKHIVGRPRPSLDLVDVLIDAKEIQSFPSGHTVHYVVFFGFLAFLVWTLLRPTRTRWALLGVCGGLIVLVGPARIYLGAHWSSDVVGGYLLGTALLPGNILLGHKWSDMANGPVKADALRISFSRRRAAQ